MVPNIWFVFSLTNLFILFAAIPFLYPKVQDEFDVIPFILFYILVGSIMFALGPVVLFGLIALGVGCVAKGILQKINAKAK